MQKIKNLAKRILKKDGFVYKAVRKCYHVLSTIKYKLTNCKQEKQKRIAFEKRIQEALQKIEGYKEKDYIVFYNPTWLGVANSTKGLFENIVPLEQVYRKKDQQKIAKAIVDNNIKTAIFSQIVDGWIEIIDEIKKLNPDVKVKVIWHGNCYEFFSDYTWNLNKDVIKLYRNKIVDCLGFVRTTMSEFYKKAGFNACYLQNNVKIDEKFKEQALEEAKVEAKSDTVKIGIYNADSRELKNIYTALSAMKLVPNSSADVVPINEGAKQFAKILGLNTTSLDDYIPTEYLLKRVAKNSINIYPTYTENAPMFPLESFEMGVPCLLGNNNDYFVGTKLGEYVILEKEDDPVYIKDRILYCLENRQEIMDLYRKWKKEFDIKCQKLVNQFIKK